jgi:hypothetical protein
METITITLPSRLAARARSLAEVQRQNLPEFLLVELQHVLKRKEPERTAHASRRPTSNWRIMSDHEVMNSANLRMEKWQALQMNLPDIVAWRSIIIGIGGYPPKLQ